ncbi:pseudouridine synthase [Paludibacterium denitrificans]|uniref:pseudouridine synthase n=1 Tax=Paludibacterium denitrificans TaxID=2675226 RepID=UPI001E4BDD4A|nr:pseudouridine synthase [Paludibacterium denitrificans]
MYTLIHTDPRFYLVNKHACSVSFHRQGEEAGLMEALRAGLQDDALWPVHRLDRMTSGLLLVARSAAVAAQLGEAFAIRWKNIIWRCRIASRKRNRDWSRATWTRGVAVPGGCCRRGCIRR